MARDISEYLDACFNTYVDWIPLTLLLFRWGLATDPLGHRRRLLQPAIRQGPNWTWSWRGPEGHQPVFRRACLEPQQAYADRRLEDVRRCDV